MKKVVAVTYEYEGIYVQKKICSHVLLAIANKRLFKLVQYVPKYFSRLSIPKDFVNVSHVKIRKCILWQIYLQLLVFFLTFASLKDDQSHSIRYQQSHILF